MNNEIREIHRAFQLLKKLVKYGITALTVMCTIHCILLTMGYDLLGIHILLCSFLFVLGLCLSQVFGLCWVHKLCVIYTCTVVLCVVFKRYGVFFNLDVSVETARAAMSAIGLFIVGATIWKIQEKSC